MYCTELHMYYIYYIYCVVSYNCVVYISVFDHFYCPYIVILILLQNFLKSHLHLPKQTDVCDSCDLHSCNMEIVAIGMALVALSSGTGMANKSNFGPQDELLKRKEVNVQHGLEQGPCCLAGV